MFYIYIHIYLYVEIWLLHIENLFSCTQCFVRSTLFSKIYPNVPVKEELPEYQLQYGLGDVVACGLGQLRAPIYR